MGTFEVYYDLYVKTRKAPKNAREVGGLVRPCSESGVTKHTLKQGF